jgi:uncharacterized protein YaaR (DUF327 family)
MAKVDFPPDSAGNFADPAIYANQTIRPRTAGKRGSERAARAGKSGKATFSSVFERARSEELGPPEELPVSQETVNRLLDDVRSAGDTLRDRPFPQEILAYKRAVRNFIHYVVDNGYEVEEREGVPNYLKPGGGRGRPDSQERHRYHTIQVVDQRLEDLAAMLVKGQLSQIALLSRLEEIRGLLVDLVF